MKTIINKETGKVLYCCFEEVAILENEVIIEQIATGNYYNFETKEFYNIWT